MSNENKKLFSERILTLLNRYLKHGSIVKATDPFYCRGEIEAIILMAYEQGKMDGKQEKIVDTFIDKIQL